VTAEPALESSSVADAGGRLPRAVRNVLANWAGYVVGIVINFFLSPLIVHHLGPSAYGVWTLLTAMTAYLGLLDLGVRSAVTRFVARSHGRGDREAAIQVASTALAIFSVTAGVALVVSAVLGLAAPSLFNIPAEYTRATPIVTVLAGATIGAALLGGALGGVIVGLERFDLVSVVDVSASLLRAALILGVIAANGGLIELAAAQLTATLAAVVATGWLSVRIYPALRLRPRWSRASASLILSYGSHAFVAQLAASVPGGAQCN